MYTKKPIYQTYTDAFGQKRKFIPTGPDDTPGNRYKRSKKMFIETMCQIQSCALYRDCNKIQIKSKNVKCINFKSRYR